MTDADYKRLMRRRWLERFLNRKLHIRRSIAEKISSYMP
jgi:hypothetical protein